MDRYDSVADACLGNSLHRRQQLEVVVICRIYCRFFFLLFFILFILLFFLNCSWGGGGGDILRYESWDVSFVSRLLYNSSLCWSADHWHGDRDLVVAGIIIAHSSASRLD